MGKYEIEPRVKIPSTVVVTRPSRFEVFMWWAMFSACVGAVAVTMVLCLLSELGVIHAGH